MFHYLCTIYIKVVHENIGMLMQMLQKIVYGHPSFQGCLENLSLEVKHQSQVMLQVEKTGSALKVRLFLLIFDK